MRIRTRVWSALAAATAAGMLVLAPATASAATAPATAATTALAPSIGPDCKGEPPTPAAPGGLFNVKPSTANTRDPFNDPNTTLYDTYGTNFQFSVYDNGCGAGGDIMPKLGAYIGGLAAFRAGGIVPQVGVTLMDAVVDPSWLAPLDGAVTDATQSVAAGVWTPWLGVALVLVSVLLMSRATRGRLPSVITGTVWALGVLVVVTWTIQYPTDSVHLLDQGIKTAVVDTANGFSHADLSGPADETGPSSSAADAVNVQWDQIVRSTEYRTWLQGEFGNADSATAQRFGPDLFRSMHFSWAEYDAVNADPTGRGKQIVDAKANLFRKTADAIQQTDPVAYQSFTGNNWGDRIGVGILGLVEILIAGLFLAVAAAIIAVAYLGARIVVPVAPAGGIALLFDSARDMAIGYMRKIGKWVVMGPVFFVAALIVTKVNSTILTTQIPMPLRLLLIGTVGVIAWKLLRPTGMAGKVRIPGWAAFFAGMELPKRQPQTDSNDGRDEERGGEGRAAGGTPTSSAVRLVHQETRAQPGRGRVFHDDVDEDEQSGRPWTPPSRAREQNAEILPVYRVVRNERVPRDDASTSEQTPPLIGSPRRVAIVGVHDRDDATTDESPSPSSSPSPGSSSAGETWTFAPLGGDSVRRIPEAELEEGTSPMDARARRFSSSDPDLPPRVNPAPPMSPPHEQTRAPIALPGRAPASYDAHDHLSEHGVDAAMVHDDNRDPASRESAPVWQPYQPQRMVSSDEPATGS